MHIEYTAILAMGLFLYKGTTNVKNIVNTKLSLFEKTALNENKNISEQPILYMVTK